MQNVTLCNYAVWKFHDFSFTHILREINVGESRSAKTAVFAIFWNLYFANFVNFRLQKMLKFIKIKIQSLSTCETASF